MYSYVTILISIENMHACADMAWECYGASGLQGSAPRSTADQPKAEASTIVISI